MQSKPQQEPTKLTFSPPYQTEQDEIGKSSAVVGICAGILTCLAYCIAAWKLGVEPSAVFISAFVVLCASSFAITCLRAQHQVYCNRVKLAEWNLEYERILSERDLSAEARLQLELIRTRRPGDFLSLPPLKE